MICGGSRPAWWPGNRLARVLAKYLILHWLVMVLGCAPPMCGFTQQAKTFLHWTSPRKGRELCIYMLCIHKQHHLDAETNPLDQEVRRISTTCSNLAAQVLEFLDFSCSLVSKQKALGFYPLI
jgi:hypothetical protein